MKGPGAAHHVIAPLGRLRTARPAGNFPYPSSYITNGHGSLPAFPVRVACDEMYGSDLSDIELLDSEPHIDSIDL